MHLFHCAPYLVAGLALAGGPASWGQSAAAPAAAYQNPVLAENGGDPFCFGEAGTYYLYRPQPDQQRVVVHTSRDLVHWSAAVPMRFAPGTGVWAPEVHRIGASLYLFYAVPHPGRGAGGGRDIRVCRLVSPTAAGSNQPVTLIGTASAAINIDPTVYHENGAYYLLWKSRPASRSGSDLCLQQLDAADPTHLLGIPRVVLPHTAYPGNKEHPTLLRQPYGAGRQARYYLFFSSGQGDQATYKIEYATAPALGGPYALQGVLIAQNPSRGLYGVGASSVVRDGQHYRWLVYRAKQTPAPGWGDRQVCLDRLELNAAQGTARCTATRRPQPSAFYPAFPR